jgi:hypothetical protein
MNGSPPEYANLPGSCANYTATKRTLSFARGRSRFRKRGEIRKQKLSILGSRLTNHSINANELTVMVRLQVRSRLSDIDVSRLRIAEGHDLTDKVYILIVV